MTPEPTTEKLLETTTIEPIETTSVVVPESFRILPVKTPESFPILPSQNTSKTSNATKPDAVAVVPSLNSTEPAPVTNKIELIKVAIPVSAAISMKSTLPPVLHENFPVYDFQQADQQRLSLLQGDLGGPAKA